MHSCALRAEFKNSSLEEGQKQQMALTKLRGAAKRLLKPGLSVGPTNRSCSKGERTEMCFEHP